MNKQAMEVLTKIMTKSFLFLTNFLLLFWLHWFAFLVVTQCLMIFTTYSYISKRLI